MSDTHGKDKIYEEFNRFKILSDQLLSLNPPNLSLNTFLSEMFAKNLIICCASYFENKIIKLLTSYLSTKTNNDEFIINFINQNSTMISKKYFQLFVFGDEKNDNINAKPFYSLFGTYGKDIANSIANNEELKIAETTFLVIGRERNLLVHNNYVCKTSQFTPCEILKKFKIAENYCDYLKVLFSKGFEKIYTKE